MKKVIKEFEIYIESIGDDYLKLYFDNWVIVNKFGDNYYIKSDLGEIYCRNGNEVIDTLNYILGGWNGTVKRTK